MTDTDTRANRYLVPGLDRGLRVLELFDRTRPEWNLSELAAAAKETATTLDALEAQLAQARARGYALCVAGFEAGIAGVGASIRGAGGDVVAAINCIGPDSQLGRDRLLAEVVGPLCETAAAISRRLGWNGSTSVGTVAQEGSHVV